jgi:hypothetical protein
MGSSEEWKGSEGREGEAVRPTRGKRGDRSGSANGHRGHGDSLHAHLPPPRTVADRGEPLAIRAGPLVTASLLQSMQWRRPIESVCTIPARGMTEHDDKPSPPPPSLVHACSNVSHPCASWRSVVAAIDLDAPEGRHHRTPPRRRPLIQPKTQEDPRGFRPRPWTSSGTARTCSSRYPKPERRECG